MFWLSSFLDVNFMNTLFFSRLAFISAICCSGLAYAANADPLLGKWKTLDYRTGFSLSDVVMSKDKQGAYAAKIVELRAVPGAPRGAGGAGLRRPRRAQQGASMSSDPGS